MEGLLRARWPGNVRQLENILERAILLGDGKNLRPEDLPVETSPAPPAEDSDLSIPRRIETLERSLIAQALARTDGNKAAAARLLELSYKALLYKIREYGLDL